MHKEKNAGEYEKFRIFKGRLGFKGSRMPDVLDGHIMTGERMLELMKDPRVKGAKSGREKFELLIQVGLIKVPIIYAVEKMGDAIDFVYMGTPPAKIILTGSGTTSHGITIMREAEARGSKFQEVFSGVTVVGAVENITRLINDEHVEVDVSKPNEAIIKILP